MDTSNKVCIVNELPLFLTVPEAARLLRIGRNTAYDLVRSGQIRSLKFGRQLRVPRQAIADLIAK